MKKDIESDVKCCAICATRKRLPGKSPGLLQQVTDPAIPWEEIPADFIVELPEGKGKYSDLDCSRLFSKQAHFKACVGLPSAQKLVKMFLQYIYRLHGVPKRIISGLS